MATSPTDWYLSADNVVQLGGFQNAIDSSYLNSATVTCTIKDTSGTAVTGISWPVTLDYVAASNGIYRATIDKAIVLTYGSIYHVEITAAESGIDGFWRIPIQATYKDS